MSSTVNHLEITPFSGSPAINPSRIAIFQALNLGDLLCATPALRALRHRFPEAEIVLLGRSWARELVDRLPSVDRFMPFPGYPGIAESPRDTTGSVSIWPRFDLAIQMHGSGRESNGFVASLGAGHSLGYGSGSDDRLTTVLEWIEDEPEPIRWLRLVGAAGATADGLHLELPITPVERARAIALLAPLDGAQKIGLHVGASDPERRWPPEAFAALADHLIDALGARIILTGSVEERPLTAAVREAMRGEALDLAGMTSLGEFAAVIGALDLLVTNDTGASHVAAAARTPSVILFGPSRPDRWAPLDLGRHHIVDAGAGLASPAERAGALRELAPDVVAARCEAALREARVDTGHHLARERIV
jgi:ADP-heptose:LPS heptosyltransferase